MTPRQAGIVIILSGLLKLLGSLLERAKVLVGFRRRFAPECHAPRDYKNDQCSLATDRDIRPLWPSQIKGLDVCAHTVCCPLALYANSHTDHAMQVQQL